MRERDRKKLARKKLKELAASKDEGALAKIREIKRQKREQYIKNKASGKCREWDSTRRGAKLWKFIEKKIKIENKPVNKSWVTWHKQKIPPLIAVIRQGDFKAVRALLGMKASPSMCYRDKTDLVLPLEEAAWLGQEKISLLLLDNGASKGKSWWYGALHGAIARKMFTLLRRLIKEGAPFNSVYARMTPLCAALTCGKERSGDVRMVRLLLNAKADVNKKTFGPRFSHRKRELTHLEVAKEYSNENCLQSILAK